MLLYGSLLHYMDTQFHACTCIGTIRSLDIRNSTYLKVTPSSGSLPLLLLPMDSGVTSTMNPVLHVLALLATAFVTNEKVKFDSGRLHSFFMVPNL